MRPNQQNRRMRGRGNRKGPNPLTRSYESNGPDVKIRGSAQQIAEKYAALARDAQASGDRVMAENYLQHAEHYNRIIAAAQAQLQTQVQRDYRDEFDDEDDQDLYPAPVNDRPANDRKMIDGTGPQPVIAEPPVQPAPAGETAPPESPAPEAAEPTKPSRRVRRPRKPAKAAEDAAPAESPGDTELAATGS
jgi:hypothetical protein